MLYVEKFCIKCGKKITSEAKYCPFCGSLQSSSDTVASVVAQPRQNGSKTIWESVKEFYSTNTDNKVMSRSVFWKSFLFNSIITFVYFIIFNLVNFWGRQEFQFASEADLHSYQMFYMTIYWVVNLVGFLGFVVMTFASISANVRRLHDTDRSGWVWFLGLVPIVNLLYIAYLTEPSITEDNRYL